MPADVAKTQNEALLKLLLAGAEITPLAALEGIGSFRLASRVHVLKARGWPIVSELIDVGDGRRVARYRLDWASDGSFAEASR